MTTIYYLSTIIFLLLELHWLVSPIEKTNNARKFLALSKLNKGKKWNEYSEEYKSELKSKIWLLYVLFWMLLGLFTFQWQVFLIMIVFNFMIIAPISKIVKDSFLYTILHWINSLIGFAFGVFVIVNHYHLKLNLTDIIASYLK
jgi:hypothetical protein